MSELVAPTAGEVLDTVVALLRDFPADRGNLGVAERWNLAVSAQRMVSQAQGIATMLLAEADAAQGVSRGVTPSATLLAPELGVTKKTAAAMTWDARRLGQHPETRQAVMDGHITMGHAKAVTRALEQMPPSFTPGQTRQAETLLLEVAEHHTPEEVLRAATRVAEQVDPTDVNETLASRLTREREQAWNNRELIFQTRVGSITFKGSLPLVEGEKFRTLITAYTTQARRDQHDRRDHRDQHTNGNEQTHGDLQTHDDMQTHGHLTTLGDRAADPLAETLTPWQRNADALIQLIQDAQNHTQAPTLGGDRPTILVTLDYNKLQTQAADAGLLPDEQPLSAGDLRRLCCDANLIPAVLDGTSLPLDVGATNRFVTNPIRKALTLRDKHCAFPYCDTPAVQCDAHHITPWWAGGPTNLHNLVLLCPTHHALIEPDKHTTRDQWKVTIHTDGHPIFTPPKHHPNKQPMRNPHAPPLTHTTTQPTGPEPRVPPDG